MSFCSGCPSNQNSVEEIPQEKRPAKTAKTAKKKGVAITRNASKFINGIAEKQNKKGWGLRLEVVPGGCAGYKYFMGFQEKSGKEDVTLELNGVKLIVDKESLDLLEGSEIDYVESLEASGLKINNPNATRACGCGKSFA